MGPFMSASARSWALVLAHLERSLETSKISIFPSLGSEVVEVAVPDQISPDLVRRICLARVTAAPSESLCISML